MTDKRFWNDDWNFTHDGNRLIDKTEIVNRLNDLNDENKELTKENEQLKALIKKTLETTPIEHELAVELKNSVRELYG